MRQTWILSIISILGVIGTIIMFSTLGYTILMLWIWKKVFPSTIFHIINGHPRIKTNFDTCNNLHYFCFGHYIHVLHMVWREKLFSSIIFLIIKVHLLNETKLYAHYNLHSCCYRHYNHVPHIGMHDIDALDLQESFFFHHFPYN